MSIFGNPSNSAAGGASGGASLFGNLGSSAAPQTSQPGQSNTLFGNLNTSQAPQQSGQGLFGGLGKSTAQSTPSLFGTPTQQQKPATTSGLFGSTTTTQPQASSLFGTQTSQAPQSSLFGSTPSQSQSQAQTAQQQQATHNPISESTSRPAYFDGLLERSRRTTNGATNNTGLGDLPSLQLGLGDISRRAKELGASSLGQRQGTDGKA
jgi:nuclear pore complex protein Nup93